MEYASFSRLSKYSCPARGYYAYELGIKTKGPSPIFMHAGSCGHAALDVFWRTDSLDEALTRLHEEWAPRVMLPADFITEAMLTTALTNYDERFHKIAYEPVRLPLNDFTGMGQIADGVSFYKADTNPPGEHLSESAITINLPGLSVPYVAILDRMMRHKRTGQLEVWDTKFTASALIPWSKFAPPLDARYEMSFQIPGYALVWKKITGLDISAGRIELIYMGASPKFELGEVRLIDIFDSWDDGMEAKFIEWAEGRVQEIAWRRETGIWPQIEGIYERQQICHSCDFKAICEVTPEKRAAVIEMEYEEKGEK